MATSFFSRLPPSLRQYLRYSSAAGGATGAVCGTYFAYDIQKRNTDRFDDPFDNPVENFFCVGIGTSFVITSCTVAGAAAGPFLPPCLLIFGGQYLMKNYKRK